jgi:hypothetical protein
VSSFLPPRPCDTFSWDIVLESAVRVHFSLLSSLVKARDTINGSHASDELKNRAKCNQRIHVRGVILLFGHTGSFAQEMGDLGVLSTYSDTLSNSGPR